MVLVPSPCFSCVGRVLGLLSPSLGGGVLPGGLRLRVSLFVCVLLGLGRVAGCRLLRLSSRLGCGFCSRGSPSEWGLSRVLRPSWVVGCALVLGLSKVLYCSIAYVQCGVVVGVVAVPACQAVGPCAVSVSCVRVSAMVVLLARVGRWLLLFWRRCVWFCVPWALVVVGVAAGWACCVAFCWSWCPLFFAVWRRMCVGSSSAVVLMFGVFADCFGAQWLLSRMSCFPVVSSLVVGGGATGAFFLYCFPVVRVAAFRSLRVRVGGSLPFGSVARACCFRVCARRVALFGWRGLWGPVDGLDARTVAVRVQRECRRVQAVLGLLVVEPVWYVG